MEHKLNCVVINPGDISSYISTVKQALLYYDKIHLIPALDVIHEGIVSIQAQMSIAAGAVMPNVQNDMMDIRDSIMAQVMGRGKQPSKKWLKKNVDIRAKAAVEKRFLEEVNSDEVVAGLVAKSEVGMAQIRRIKKYASPALQDGLVSIWAEGDIVGKLKDVLQIALTIELKRMLMVAGIQMFGGPALPLDGAEEVLFRYSGKQAASMTSFYDCPLMTSSAEFMQSLAHNLETAPPAKWLTREAAERQWKNNRLSLTVCDAELPSPERMDIEDILELRRVVGDELGYYRLKLAEFADKLRNAPWDENFEKEASMMLDIEVRPAIEQARDALLKDPPLPYRLKKAYQAAKNERRRLKQIAEFLPIPEPVIAWTAFCAGVDKYIEEKYLYQPDKSVKNGMLFIVKARTILQ